LPEGVLRKIQQIEKYLTEEKLKEAVQREAPINVTCPICGKLMQQRGVVGGLMMGQQGDLSIIYTCKEHQNLIAVTTVTKIGKEESQEEKIKAEASKPHQKITYIY
jgi:hypothetical protein